jgi:Zinc-ribbon containing domain
MTSRQEHDRGGAGLQPLGAWPPRELQAERGIGRKTRRRPVMADPVPSGSDVSAGTYKCTNCGYELQVGSTDNLPPCPSCHNGQYNTVTGGDSVNDPYPDRSS